MSTGVAFGRYCRGRRIAAGGMGEVFVATQLGLGDFEKTVALKLLLPDLAEDTNAVQMFLAEARLSARMHHPNLVQVLDVGLEAGRYYLAMELVRGVSLASLIRALRTAGQQASGELIAFIGRALCDGLAHAHALVGADGRPLDLVHRDVNPQNVLVSVDGGVKLGDFGIARSARALSRTRPGNVKGKLEYLAPEQLDNRADRRTDIWAAGLTLYCLATLQSPFRRDNDGATMRAIEREPLVELTLLRPDLPKALVDAVTRATEKDPARRFATALEMRDALPLPPRRCAAILGELVSGLCGADLARLDAAPEDRGPRTSTALGAARADATLVTTASVEAAAAASSDEATGAVTLDASATPRVRGTWVRRAAIACAALVAIAAVLGAWFRNSSDPTPLSASPATAQPPDGTRSRIADPVAVAAGVVPAEPESQAEARFAPGGESEPGKRTGAGPASLPGAPGAQPAPVPAPVGAAPEAPASPSLAGPAARATTPPRPPRRSTPTESGGRSVGDVGNRSAGSGLSEAGFLAIDARPWAVVVVDGQRIGDTPIARYPVEKRRVQVVLSSPETGRTVKRNVTVAPGKTSRVFADLR